MTKKLPDLDNEKLAELREQEREKVNKTGDAGALEKIKVIDDAADGEVHVDPPPTTRGPS